MNELSAECTTSVKCVKSVEVYCTCQLPWVKAINIYGDLAQCSKCKEWFHQKYMDIPTPAFVEQYHIIMILHVLCLV